MVDFLFYSLFWAHPALQNWVGLSKSRKSEYWNHSKGRRIHSRQEGWDTFTFLISSYLPCSSINQLVEVKTSKLHLHDLATVRPSPEPRKETSLQYLIYSQGHILWCIPLYKTLNSYFSFFFDSNASLHPIILSGIPSWLASGASKFGPQDCLLLCPSWSQKSMLSLYEWLGGSKLAHLSPAKSLFDDNPKVNANFTSKCILVVLFLWLII